MELILPFALKPPGRQISIKDQLLLLGSCFAEEIGDKMMQRRFRVLMNPHGILYNPASLAIALQDYVQNRVYTRADLFQRDGLWHSFHHHGRFSQSRPEKTLESINHAIEKTHLVLKEAQWLVVTFGSAYVYHHKKTGQPVGNCHKVPSAEFDKILITIPAITGIWQEQIEALKKFNPHLSILFTISPVRYVRDGLIGNNRSKAILIDAVHRLLETNKNCFYFPAYEIVIDQLRDYRFFKEDLVHPNQLAIDYVWEKFSQNMCDAATQQFLAEYEPLLKGLQHRAFQEETAEHQNFKLHLKEKISALEKKYAL